MRLVCENCGVKYSISDEKVKNKVFKIRCKKCQHVIIVRGNEAQPAENKPDESQPTAPPWHIVLDSERVGPMSAEQIEDYFQQGRIDGDSFIWREGFEDWIKIIECQEFSHLVPAQPQINPDVAQTPSPSQEPLEDNDATVAFQAPAGLQDNMVGDDEETKVVADNYNESPLDTGYGAVDQAEPDPFAANDEPQYQEPDPTPFENHQEEPVASPFQMAQANSSDSIPTSSPASFGSIPSAEETNEPSPDLSFGGSNDNEQSLFSSLSNNSASNIANSEQDDDMIGQRNENSVLFSLNSLQSLSQTSNADAQDSPQMSDKSGLIDIKALAASNMSGTSEKDKGDFGGDAELFGGAAISVPTMMPMGTRRTNKLLIVGIVSAAVVVLGLLGVLGYILLYKDKTPKTTIVEKTAEPSMEELAELESNKTKNGVAKDPNKNNTANNAVANNTNPINTNLDNSKKEAIHQLRGAMLKSEAKAKQSAPLAKNMVKTEKTKRRDAKKESKKDPIVVAKNEPIKETKAKRKTEKKSKKVNKRDNSKDEELDDLLNGLGSSKKNKNKGKKTLGLSTPKKTKNLDKKPPKEVTDSNVPTKLNKKSVQKVIRKHYSKIRNCYENKNSGNLGGTIKIKFVIQRSGKVKSNAKISTTKFKGKDVGNCVLGVVKGMTFGKFSGDPITINYPFVLQ